MSQLVDPPLELLVCLAVQRHGEREWAAVHRSVSTVLSALGHAGPPVALEPLYRASREAAGADAVLGTCVGELIARRIAYLTTRVGSLKASLAKAEADEAKGRTGRTRGGATVDSLGQDVEGVDSWVELAEEEKNPRRATVQGALLKFVQSITKHKWAHPFKRPVTEKEAPDYKDIVKSPMDLSTLRKRVEAGTVMDMAGLVRDLDLIFDNAMLYNPPVSDYYRMAATLKDVVKQQMELYSAWYIAKNIQPGSPFPPLDPSTKKEMQEAAKPAVQAGTPAPAPTAAPSTEPSPEPTALAGPPAETPPEAPAEASAEACAAPAEAPAHLQATAAPTPEEPPAQEEAGAGAATTTSTSRGRKRAAPAGVGRRGAKR